MKPLKEDEIPKVIQAIRQTQSKKVLVKLLSRIKVNRELLKIIFIKCFIR